MTSSPQEKTDLFFFSNNKDKEWKWNETHKMRNKKITRAKHKSFCIEKEKKKEENSPQKIDLTRSKIVIKFTIKRGLMNWRKYFTC